MLARHLAFVGILAVGLVATASARPQSAPSATTRPSVSIASSLVQRGERITVTGRNWRRNVIVDLLIGPPRSEADVVGRARTTSAGTLRRYLRIASNTTPGRWVLLACRRECRVKAIKGFRVTS